jgi:hypothetical protein
MVQEMRDQGMNATSERRREPRSKANHSALLTAPGAPPLEAWVRNVSAKGVGLRVPQPIPVGTAVRVEADELLLFGTITRCEPVDGAYEVGVVLCCPLAMLSELRKLNAALFVEQIAGR